MERGEMEMGESHHSPRDKEREIEPPKWIMYVAQAITSHQNLDSKRLLLIISRKWQG